MSINFFDYSGYYWRINFSKPSLPCLFPSLLAKITLRGPFHDGWDMLWTLVFRWQGVLCKMQGLLSKKTSNLHNAVPTKVSWAFNTDLTNPLELVLREGLWSQTLLVQILASQLTSSL